MLRVAFEPMTSLPPSLPPSLILSHIAAHFANDICHTYWIDNTILVQAERYALRQWDLRRDVTLAGDPFPHVRKVLNYATLCVTVEKKSLGSQRDTLWYAYEEGIEGWTRENYVTRFFPAPRGM